MNIDLTEYKTAVTETELSARKLQIALKNGYLKYGVSDFDKAMRQLSLNEFNEREGE